MAGPFFLGVAVVPASFSTADSRSFFPRACGEDARRRISWVYSRSSVCDRVFSGFLRRLLMGSVANVVDKGDGVGVGEFVCTDIISCVFDCGLTDKGKDSGSDSDGDYAVSVGTRDF